MSGGGGGGVEVRHGGCRMLHWDEYVSPWMDGRLYRHLITHFHRPSAGRTQQDKITFKIQVVHLT